MRIRTFSALSTAFVAAIALSAAPLNAAGPKSKAPKTTSTKPATSPKGASAKGPAAKPTKTTTKTTKTTTKTASAQGRGAKSTTVAGSSKKTTTTMTTANTTTTTNTTGTTTGTTTWTPNNPVATKLAGKPNQLAKAMAVLPEGTDLNLATMGFKNFGQFNAAVNAATNLGIPFADLKASMTGFTLAGEPTNLPTQSLGQSIKTLKPGVDADAAAATATTQANNEDGQ